MRLPTADKVSTMQICANGGRRSAVPCSAVQPAVVNSLIRLHPGTNRGVPIDFHKCRRGEAGQNMFILLLSLLLSALTKASPLISLLTTLHQSDPWHKHTHTHTLERGKGGIQKAEYTRRHTHSLCCAVCLAVTFACLHNGCVDRTSALLTPAHSTTQTVTMMWHGTFRWM